MTNQELIDYVRQKLQRGVSKEEIKNSLLANNNWEERDVEEAFSLIEQSGQPVSYNTPETDFLQPNTSSVKTSKKPTALIISIVLGVIVIGGGVFAYFYYFQSPERIVRKMNERMVDLKSLEYTGQITIEIETSNFPSPSSLENGNLQQPKELLSSKQKVLMNFSGASDLHHSNNPKAMLNLDIKTDILPQVFELEMRTISNIVYLKLNNIPDLDLGVPDLGFFDLSLLENQWIKVDPKTLKENLGLEKSTELKQFSPEQIEQIKEAVIRKKVFKITEKLPSEKIDGINTHRYKFRINKEELLKLIADKVTKNESLTKAELSKPLDAIETIEGEIWIGKEDLLLYKILLNFNTKETEEIKSGGKITILTRFKNHNKAIQIDIPTPIKTLEEIMEEIMGKLLGEGLENLGLNEEVEIRETIGEAREMAKDARIMASISQIRAVAELIYSKEGGYDMLGCAHPDAAFLCQDVKTISGKEPIIYSTQKDYCVYTKLIFRDYYCINSKGVSRETSVYPGRRGYCDGRTFICP